MKSALKTVGRFAIALTAGLFLAGCGDSHNTPTPESTPDISTPEGTAEAVATAIFKGDKETIQKFLPNAPSFMEWFPERVWSQEKKNIARMTDHFREDIMRAADHFSEELRGLGSGKCAEFKGVEVRRFDEFTDELDIPFGMTKDDKGASHMFSCIVNCSLNGIDGGGFTVTLMENTAKSGPKWVVVMLRR